MTDFCPGQRVRLIRNINKTGVLIRNSDEDGNWIVKWDNRDDYDDVSEKRIEPLGDPQTPLGGLKDFRFGGLRDLRFAITLNRLSGKLSDFIYSLNLTNTVFYPYQFKPLITFLNSQSRSLLIADEVGLGKTIEAGLIWTELEMRKEANKLLVICPASLREKWKKELWDKFNIVATIRSGHELEEEMKRIQYEPTSSSFSIVSLQGVRGNKTEDSSLIKQLKSWQSDPYAPKFDLFILDEAHSIRNRETTSYRFVSLVQQFSYATLMLSATPIQTSQTNLFSLLNLIDPEQFSTEERLDAVVEENSGLVRLCGLLSKRKMSEREFRGELQGIIEDSEGSRKDKLQSIFNQKNLQEVLSSDSGRLKTITELMSLNLLFRSVARMRKADVIEERVIRDIYAEKTQMNPAEAEFYKAVTDNVLDYAISQDVHEGFLMASAEKMLASSPQAAFLHWVGKHASAEDTAEYENYLPSETGSEEDNTSTSGFFDILRKTALYFERKEELLAEDSKLTELIKALSIFWKKHPKEKVLLFSFYKITLRYLEEKLKSLGYKVLRYDGDIPNADRVKVMEDFKKGDYQVLLASEIAAEGIDLQFMKCVVNYDLPWNPARVEQRIGRVDRIGQESPKIFVYNLFYRGTIDETVYDRLLSRLGIFERSLGLCEDVVGKLIANLTQDLFNPRLSEKQKQERIDQTKLALENQILLSESNDLSEVYKYIQREIAKAQEMEKFVTGQDLIAFIRLFLETEGSGGRLVEKDVKNELYHLDLTPELRAQFSDFLRRHRDAYRTELLHLETPPLLRIKNQKGSESWGFERVTQNHPFIKFISSWMKEKKISPAKTAAIQVRKGSLPARIQGRVKPGFYFFLIDLWTKSDKNDWSVVIKNFVYSIETQEKLTEEEGDTLLHYTTLYGEDEPTVTLKGLLQKTLLDLYKEAEDRSAEDFDNYTNKEKADFLLESDFILKQLENEKIKLEDDYRNKVFQALHSTEQGREGRLARIRNEYERAKAANKERTAKILINRESFNVDQRTIQVGLLEVKE